MCETLDLSFSNSGQLNKIIDEKLPGQPRFQHDEVFIAGEVFELYSRDIMECLEALWVLRHGRDVHPTWVKSSIETLSNTRRGSWDSEYKGKVRRGL